MGVSLSIKYIHEFTQVLNIINSLYDIYIYIYNSLYDLKV